MTPALTGLTYVSFMDFQHARAAPVAHHAARLIGAIVFAAVIYFGAGGPDASGHHPRPSATAAAAHFSGRA